MILLFALALALLALLNYAVSRSLLYPPFLFCSVWLVQLVGLQLAGDFFYQISTPTLWIFLGGAAAFTAGGLVSSLLKIGQARDEVDTQTLTYIDLIVKGGLITGVIMLPLYWTYLKELTGGIDPSHFFKQLRLATLQHAESDASQVNLVTAMIPIFVILATVSLYEYCRSGKGQWRTCGSVLTALIYQIGSTARTQVLILIISLFTAMWFRSPKRALRWGSLGVAGFLVLFFLNQILAEKVGARSNESVLENVPQLVRGLSVYTLGSAVAFDGTVRNPNEIPNTFPITGYFSRTLNKLGFHFDPVIPFLKDIAINSHLAINAYTIYFSYYADYGIVGTAAWMSVLGFATTLIFRKASTNDPPYVLLFGPAMYCTLMTFFADTFLLEMGFWIKTSAAGFFFYRAIPAIVKYRHSTPPVPAGIS